MLGSQSCEELDARIAELELQLAELRRKRNAMAPLFRLPQELMWSIMSALKDDCSGPSVQSPYWKRTGRELGNFMRTSRHLRALALSSSRIWSHVNLDEHDDDWHELCLLRAGTSSLILRGTLDGTTNSRCLKRLDSSLLTRTWRVQLVVDLKPGVANPVYNDELNNVTEFLQHSLTSSLFPSLTSVQLYSRNVGYLTGPLDRVPLRLQYDFTPVTKIQIVDLVLDSCKLASLPALPELRHLTTNHVIFDVHYNSLRDLLSHTPDLLVLRLLNLRTYEKMTYDQLLSAISTIGKHSRLQLPLLSTLELSGDYTDIGRVLCMLPGPKDHFKLCIRRQIGPHRNLLALEPDECTVWRQLDQSLFRNIESKVINFLRDTTYHPVTGRHFSQLYSGDSGHHVELKILPWASYTQHLAHQSLDLHLLNAYDLNISELLDSTEHLIVMESHFDTFASILGTCNHIKCLALLYYGLDERHDSTGPFSKTKPLTLSKAMQQILSKWSENGMPLERLEIHYPKKDVVVMEGRDIVQEGIGVHRDILTSNEEIEWKSAGWIHDVAWIASKYVWSPDTD